MERTKKFEIGDYGTMNERMMFHKRRKRQLLSLIIKKAVLIIERDK